MPLSERITRTVRLVPAIALLLSGQAAADDLVSLAELSRVRVQADAGQPPLTGLRDALISDANAPWRWGSVSGEFTTTLEAGTINKQCHPVSDPSANRYLKDGAPDAYAKVLAYLTVSAPDPALAVDARSRVLDLVDTTGFRGLDADQSANNQCILELAISIPVWIETATLLEHTPVWSSDDRVAFSAWLAGEVYPRVAWASRVRRNNWGAAGSAAASALAAYVDGIVPTLNETAPTVRALSPSAAVTEHDAQQLARIGTSWRGDTQCPAAGIQAHGGIPDELRRGSAGCGAAFLPSASDEGHSYQTMHVELLVLHAEAQRRRGSTALFDARLADGTPAILQAIYFVVDNRTPGGLSWPWGTRSGALVVADRYYGARRLAAVMRAQPAPTSRGGRSLPYAGIAPLAPAAPGFVVQ